MKLTLFGVRSLVFYATVVVAYVSAPYVNLFFLLLAFLTLHWILAFVWTSGSLRGLSVQVDELPAVVANTAARVPVRFQGERGRLFDVNATLFLEVPGQKRPLRASGGVAVLDRRAQSNVAVPGLPRGVYKVARADAWSSYPFGLLKRILPIPDAPL